MAKVNYPVLAPSASSQSAWQAGEAQIDTTTLPGNVLSGAAPPASGTTAATFIGQLYLDTTDPNNPIPYFAFGGIGLAAKWMSLQTGVVK